MARSAKKGPYVDHKLLMKVKKLEREGKREPIKTWARNSQIPPEFVNYRFLVHNGRTFVEVLVTEDMIGHYLGEFAPTRTFRGHGKVTKRILEKT